MNDDLEARIRASFARQTIMETFGGELLEVGRGSVVIAAPIAPHLLQQAGSAHAAVAFGLGDSAAGYSALTTMPEGSDVVTVEMKINLLAPAVGSRLIATGRVLRAGRRIVTVQSEVEAEAADGSRKPVAVMLGTMVPVTA
ncbi:hotdog fold thioesterase [Paracoccus sp. S-4012]|uniref:PaaI family thioesterase n=1 Tax=Paracoccus sp. S-4012 TaxID=2665648 RepID=UPI0012AF22AD|nr:PaaI family thioesterase [Paracoccus sp. S-4012]MRX51515.1 hotdog fold thioesterase [Paracoccus sp. S-4012]